MCNPPPSPLALLSSPQEIADFNSRSWPSEAALLPPPITSEMTLTQLAQNPRAMILTGVIAAAWLATGLLYYGFAMSCENLEGSIFVGAARKWN